ncbi:MAG: hypothetical protein SF187_24575 [Deltaproteobacteria bacterium]|nr:hypothetical protein [Deltaproteobacteria bacterium]
MVRKHSGASFTSFLVSCSGHIARGRVLSMALVGALVAPLIAQAPAHAQSTPAPEVQPVSGESSISPAPAPEWGPSFHHKGQFGISIMPGSGYRMIVPYEDGIDCGDAESSGKRVCTARSPTFIDAELSYGITTRLDLVAAARFGLEKDFTRTRQFAVMPGLRIWLDQDEALKFFTMLQAVFDSTDQKNTVSKSDYGARVGLGFMYDPIRNLGFYAQLGATFGFKRWFRIEADMGAGVQVRFP